jgi:hypothetical protein
MIKKEVNELEVNEYYIQTVIPMEPDSWWDSITIKRTSKVPERWGIFHTNFQLSKVNKEFTFGERPSSDDDTRYFNEFRFVSAQEALDFWNDTISKQFLNFEQVIVFYQIVGGGKNKEYSTHYDPEKPELISIGVPFEFGDGDYLVIDLKKRVQYGDVQWYFTDHGHTYMHVGFWTKDKVLDKIIEDREFRNLLNTHVVDYNVGAFEKETSITTIADDLKDYTDVLTEFIERGRS